MPNTVQDFMVGLGYRVDQNSKKRFDDTLGSSTKKLLSYVGTIGKLSTGMELAAVASFAAIATGVDKVAGKYEQLYYLGVRSGASVGGINKFAYAISQLGGSADGAKSSIEGLGAFLRSSPGAESVLHGIGVQTRAHGRMRDTADIALSIGDALKSKPVYLQQQYASMFGIDLPTLFALRGNVRGFEKDLDHYYKMFGLNADRAAAISVKFEQRQRAMQAVTTVLYERAMTGIEGLILDAAPKMGKALDWVEREIKQHQAVFEAIWKDMGEGLLPFEIAIKELAPNVWEGLKPLDQFFRTQLLGSWQDVEKGFQTTWHDLQTDFADEVPALIAKLKPLTDYFKNGDWKLDVGNFGRDLTALAKALNDAAAGRWKAAGADLVQIYHNDTDGRTDLSRAVGDNVTGGAFSRSANRMHESLFGGKWTTADVQNRESQGIRILEKAGVPPTAAVALVSGDERESTLGLNPESWKGVTRGIAQWSNSRRAAILAGTGIDVWTDQDYSHQLAAQAWELQKGGETGSYAKFRDDSDVLTAVKHATKYYERPAATDFETTARQAIARDIGARMGFGLHPAAAPSKPVAPAAPTLNATTTVHVHGQDAHAIGHQVAQRQTRVHADAIRNMKALAI